MLRYRWRQLRMCRTDWVHDYDQKVESAVSLHLLWFDLRSKISGPDCNYLSSDPFKQLTSRTPSMRSFETILQYFTTNPNSTILPVLHSVTIPACNFKLCCNVFKHRKRQRPRSKAESKAVVTGPLVSWYSDWFSIFMWRYPSDWTTESLTFWTLSVPPAHSRFRHLDSHGRRTDLGTLRHPPLSTPVVTPWLGRWSLGLGSLPVWLSALTVL